jgi:hypothetical protein
MDEFNHHTGSNICSVAANGHKNIVKPIRYGERAGTKIICNRQWLVSNAFEELLQDKMPGVHRIIRRNYNHVGRFVHRYYGIFKNKYFADLIFVLMKPLEWIFVFCLYTFDKHPEDRIASQYISEKEKEYIRNQLWKTTIKV